MQPEPNEIDGLEYAGRSALQLERYWESGRLLAASLLGESLSPLELKLRVPDTQACSERLDEVRRWIRGLESDGRYQIEWIELNSRVLGRHRIPARILVPNEADALCLIGKTSEAAQFRALYAATVETLPELSMWLTRNPLVALENARHWNVSWLSCCGFVTAHAPDCICVNETLPVWTRNSSNAERHSWPSCSTSFYRHTLSTQAR